MEKIITFKPLELDEVRVEKASPITGKRSKITKDIILKFENFNEIKKGAIEEEELLAIKPGLDVASLPEYEENLNLDKLITKIEKANKVLRKYGYVNLCISPDNVRSLINEKSSSLEEENRKLNIENTAIKDTMNEIVSLDEIQDTSDEKVKLIA